VETAGLARVDRALTGKIGCLWVLLAVPGVGLGFAFVAQNVPLQFMMGIGMALVCFKLAGSYLEHLRWHPSEITSSKDGVWRLGEEGVVHYRRQAKKSGLTAGTTVSAILEVDEWVQYCQIPSDLRKAKTQLPQLQKVFEDI